jgi:predicted nucleic acid-binding protein
MSVVVDASVVVAALVDDGPVGRWAETILSSDALAAPHLVYAEVANIFRRAAQCSEISHETASLAHADLLALRIELFPYESVAERIWELRNNVTAYDAWYVALAEAIDAPLATLDRRLASATGPRCTFATPDPVK